MNGVGGMNVKWGELAAECQWVPDIHSDVLGEALGWSQKSWLLLAFSGSSGIGEHNRGEMRTGMVGNAGFCL